MMVSETTLSKVQKSSLLLTYEVNAVGPILVIKVECILTNFFQLLLMKKVQLEIDMRRDVK